MTFQATSNPAAPQVGDLLAAAASAAGVNPGALATAGTLIDLATQLQSGAGAAVLADLGASLLAQARPELAQALALLRNTADLNVTSSGCFGNRFIADHPQYGQASLDFCSPLPEFMPPAIDPTTGDFALSGIKFAEETRLLRFYSPLPASTVLLIDSFNGNAALSQPFCFQLNLLSTDASIPLKTMMAKNVSVGVRLADGSEAYINGYVDCFGFARADGGFAFYEARVVPWFSFLSKRTDSRIYQDMTVLGVIEKVFEHYKLMAKYVFRTIQTYEPESYIVQYNETDEHFVSRLMEQHGLFYYFEHDVNSHCMVISDDSCHSGFCPPHAAHAEIQFNAGNRAQHEDGVTSFAARRELHSSRVTLNTFDFKAPHGQRMIEADTVAEQGEVPFLDVYRGNPAFAYKNRECGEREARRCLEEMEWQGKLFHGKSDCRGLVAGHTFKLLDHHWSDEDCEGDNDFLVVEVRYEARNNYFGKSTEPVYRNSFTALRRKIPYRPRIVHHTPRMGGPQTATVVGPQGVEIHTDEFGRIKVQFPWDRYGRNDESSSCWIRVSQPLAGQGWGMITVPRVGQEVIVDFLEGDPARPLAIGRLYNADQPVPYGLPTAAHMMGLKSRSTPGGGGYSEVVIHDAKDKELLNIRAQKEMVTTVLGDQVTVVHGKNQANFVTTGSQSTSVSGNIDIESAIGRIRMTAATEIDLDVGASRITLKADGTIEVRGVLVIANVRQGKQTAPDNKLGAGVEAQLAAAGTDIVNGDRLADLDLPKPSVNKRSEIERSINDIRTRMDEIDAGGFKANGELLEYAKLNRQLFRESAKLAEIRRKWRNGTPWAQWTSKDWEEAHADVALAFAGRGEPKLKVQMPSPADFFKGTRNSARVLGQIKAGDNHAFSPLVENYASFGSISYVLQPSTGQLKEMLIIPGHGGYYEFIKHDSGVIYHRLFRPLKGPDHE